MTEVPLYRNQFILLQSKSSDWFLYDRDLRHERVNTSPLTMKKLKQKPWYRWNETSFSHDSLYLKTRKIEMRHHFVGRLIFVKICRKMRWETFMQQSLLEKKIRRLQWPWFMPNVIIMMHNTTKIILSAQCIDVYGLHSTIYGVLPVYHPNQCMYTTLATKSNAMFFILRISSQ